MMIHWITHTIIETSIAFDWLKWAEMGLIRDHCARHMVVHVSSSGATSNYGTVIFVMPRICIECIEIAWL